ncbi:MAG: Rne/Rng family ribonuclease [Pseudomonadota bacterium]
MGKKMLIDATHPEETRVVVVDGNKVDDFDFESINKRQLAGNIYLAKVTRVEPSLQAAFVDYGGNRHGFLAFAEIHPDYYQIPVADREALIAEEERAAREENSDDATDEAAKKPKRSRRSRSKKSSAPAAEATSEVSGLEVISVDEQNAEDQSVEGPGSLAVMDLGEEATTKPENAASDAPAEMVDAPEADATEVEASKEDVIEADPEIAEAEPADPVAPEPQAEASVDEPSTEEPAPAENAPEDAAAEAEEPASEPQDEATPPKNMAEGAGLDDDRVTEEIEDTSASTGRTKQAQEASFEETQPEEPSSDTPSEEPTEPKSEAEPSSEEPTDGELSADTETPNGETDAAVTGQEAETADAAETDETAQSTKETAKDERPKKRQRRTRKRKPSNDEADSSDTESEEEDVEQVGAEDLQEEVAASRARRRRTYKIQDVVKVRQILLVQVVKEERGNKGAALTTYLSLAGRYCVLMPNTARGGGISRKITQIGDRKRLREIVDELEVPKGMGLIVRTAGAERTRPEIKRDYEFLSRQWEQVRDLTMKSIAPCLIYEEGSLIKRSIRDLYAKEIDSIAVEGDTGYREAKDYMKMLMPSHAKNVQQYTDPIPLFIRYQVESTLNGMFSPTVQLKSGGYIVIGVTEALVAVDVNSGRATKQGSIEETALQTNLEAADEVARQCRLRDLAGLIVIDFIDMEENRNNRAVEKRMKDRLKTDRARIQIGRISSFGLMEMSRQRLRPGMLEATTTPCPHCQGTGVIRSDENMALSILREVEEEGVRGRSAEIQVAAPIDVANFLLNHKRGHIARIEARYSISILIIGDPSLTSPNFRIERSKQVTRVIDKAPAAVTADSVVTTEELEEDLVEDAEIVDDDDAGEKRESRSRRRRGRRGGRKRRGGETDDEQQTSEESSEEASSEETSEAPEDEKPKRPRRRRNRRGKGSDPSTEAAEAEASSSSDESEAGSETDETSAEPEAAPSEAPSDEPIEAHEEAAVETAQTAEAVEEDADEVVAETVETTPKEPAPEPEAAPEPAPAAEDPARPKRKGWWSFGG